MHFICYGHHLASINSAYTGVMTLVKGTGMQIDTTGTREANVGETDASHFRKLIDYITHCLDHKFNNGNVILTITPYIM